MRNMQIVYNSIWIITISFRQTRLPCRLVSECSRLHNCLYRKQSENYSAKWDRGFNKVTTCFLLNNSNRQYSETPFERPPPLERPLVNVNLNINVLIFTPDERPPLLKGHFSDAKGVASQEGFHCTCLKCGSLSEITKMV